MSVAVSLAAFAILLVCSRPAAAQAVGTYAGTSADGSAISLTVSYDAKNQLAITKVSNGYTVACPKTVPAFTAGSTYFTDTPVAAPAKFSITKQYAYLNQFISGRFTGDTINGAIYTATPTINFTFDFAKPKTAVVCISQAQMFTATLQGADAARTDRRAPAVLIYSVHE